MVIVFTENFLTKKTYKQNHSCIKMDVKGQDLRLLVSISLSIDVFLNSDLSNILLYF